MQTEPCSWEGSWRAGREKSKIRCCIACVRSVEWADVPAASGWAWGLLLLDTVTCLPTRTNAAGRLASQCWGLDWSHTLQGAIHQCWLGNLHGRGALLRLGWLAFGRLIPGCVWQRGWAGGLVVWLVVPPHRKHQQFFHQQHQEKLQQQQQQWQHEIRNLPPFYVDIKRSLTTWSRMPCQRQHPILFKCLNTKRRIWSINPYRYQVLPRHFLGLWCEPRATSVKTRIGSVEIKLMHGCFCPVKTRLARTTLSAGAKGLCIFKPGQSTIMCVVAAVQCRNCWV